MNRERKNELSQKAYELRKRFVEIFTNIGYGHLTTAFSETEILVTLYYEIMKCSKEDWENDKNDILVLSKGHGAGMLFPIFEDLGYLSREEMEDTVRVGGDFKKLQRYFVPGFEFYGGSLGIGLGMAAGLALGKKLDRDNRMIFCLLGDAECYEGSIWEAMLFAGHNELNNLVVVVDRNYMGCSDFTENMCRLEPFEDKWRSCGWDTKVVDGHSIEELEEALRNVRSRRIRKPLCIIANTVKGKGLENVCNVPVMHGYMPKKDEIENICHNIQMLN